MGVGVESPGPQAHQWKSQYALATIEIDPGTDKFSTGKYRAAYIARQPETSPARSITVCAKLTCREVPLMVKLNNLEEALPITVNKSAFFRYVLPDGIDYDDHFVLVQVTPKSKLAVYIHSQRYPGPEKGHLDYMLGDLPAKNLKELLSSTYRLEYYKEAKTLVYNAGMDQVEYQQSYDHLSPERLLPENNAKVDGKLLRSLTTWTPEHEP